MTAVAWLLISVGTLISLVGGIWLVVLAFKEHVLWGLGSLFVPFVGLVFAIMFWSIAKKPFLIALGGSVLSVVGAVVLAATSMPAQLPS
jgi:hypothetical protein